MRIKRQKIAIIVSICLILISLYLTLSKGDLTMLDSAEKLGTTLGVATLMPTIIAVVLAFISHNVIISLLIGFLSGVLLTTLAVSQNVTAIPYNFVKEMWQSISAVIFDTENLKIVLLCFVVGGMVEVVKSSGGFEALAIKLTKRVNTPRKASFIGSLLGCLIFFDDYANALIVGPIMKPIFDRVKISREKLSYLVDSTAAPVTGIAIISSWVAVEVSSIEQGLQMVGVNENGFAYFLKGVPYTFYCIFALTFIFLNSLTGRDFGPMLKAEKRARKGEPVSAKSKEVEGKSYKEVNDLFAERIFVAISAVTALVVIALLGFIYEGRKKAIALDILNPYSSYSISNIIKCISLADTMKWIIYSALIATVYTIVYGLIKKLFKLNEAINSWLFGAKKLFSTIILLLLAWCLADTVERLGTSYYVVEIISSNVSWRLVPILIFLCCCIVSFASGSYGCLFVVMPLAIPLAYRIISMGVTSNDEIYLTNCIASVMAGSIFGDHCSPITDCTILSALGSGCDTMEHVQTQMPYALTVGIISIFAILAISYGINVIIVWAIAITIEAIILLTIGKKPE